MGNSSADNIALTLHLKSGFKCKVVVAERADVITSRQDAPSGRESRRYVSCG